MTKTLFSYWNAQKLLSHNAMFNFAIGGRSLGKTFDFKRRCIRNWIKYKHEFIYLRRYEPEFEDKDTFFSDPNLLSLFPDYEFRVNGMIGYARLYSEDENAQQDWQPVVYFVVLAKTYAKKSVSYPNVKWIIFDEFIIETGVIHYIRNEVTRFLDFYNTVDRFRDFVKVAFLANPISIVNPYFLYFHLKPRKPITGSTFTKASSGLICLEVIRNEKFASEVSQTNLGKLTEGTPYFRYAIGGDFNDNTENLISKKSTESKFVYAFIFDGQQLGVWCDYNDGTYYVVNKYPKDAKPYVLTKADMNPNLIMIERRGGILKSLKRLYMYGCVKFDSVNTRSLFYDILDYLSIR